MKKRFVLIHEMILTDDAKNLYLAPPIGSAEYRTFLHPSPHISLSLFFLLRVVEMLEPFIFLRDYSGTPARNTSGQRDSRKSPSKTFSFPPSDHKAVFRSSHTCSVLAIEAARNFLIAARCRVNG